MHPDPPAQTPHWPAASPPPQAQAILDEASEILSSWQCCPECGEIHVAADDQIILMDAIAIGEEFNLPVDDMQGPS